MVETPAQHDALTRLSWSRATQHVEGEAAHNDVIVVGSGPTGLSTALMLARHGLQVTVVTRETWVADSPRAHITNQRTMEVLRAVGLEAAVRAQASPRETMASQVVAASFTGPEDGRAWSWGNNPARQSEYRTASPADGCDIPQDRLEPILLAEAARLGVRLRFQTSFAGIAQDDAGVDVHVVDGITGKAETLRTLYVVAADGGQSPVAKALDFDFLGEAGIAPALNISFTADLGEHVAHRPGSLYEIIQNRPEGPTRAMIRMVRPWHEWSASLVYLGDRNSRLTPDEAVEELRRCIGDDSVKITINGLFPWRINRIVAADYGKGRVFLAGDAAHRHPPTNGLGANTCVQDAFNIAWKIAYAVKGLAGPGLLESYSAERQPVGQGVVNRAVDSWALGAKLLPAMGLGAAGATEADFEARTAGLAQLTEASAAGAEQRRALREVLDEESYIFEAHGVEMNQVYRSSAVVDDGTELVYERDAQLYSQPTSHPGARLPHAWVGGTERTVSTLDLVGGERFTLLVREQGQAWLDAAAVVAEELGLDLATVRIGHGGDALDLYGDFERRSGIDETGCLLVRPDQHIALRRASAEHDPAAVLRAAFAQILDRG